jgi:anti-sigma factor RsiW
MPDLYRDLLGAYLDGELHDRRMMEMQAHLESCQECRQELDSMRSFSHLLHTSPDPEFTPGRLFTSRLMLQLPRREQTRTSSKSFTLLKWLTPAFLLISWVFLQVTTSLSTLITLAGKTGLLGNSSDWLPAASSQTVWFAASQAAFGGFINLQGSSALRFLNDLGVWFQYLDGAFLWQAALVVLYCTWLGIWWINRRGQNFERRKMD